MIFNFNKEKEVVALLGAGSMGMAIAERVAQNRIVRWATSAKRHWKPRVRS